MQVFYHKVSMGHNCKFSVIKNQVKVIRHVSGLDIEFLENKDTCIFLHFMVNNFIMWYSYHVLISPF